MATNDKPKRKTPYHKARAPIDSVFSTLLANGMQSGIIPARTQEAREWYRARAKGVSNVDENSLMNSDPRRFRQTVVPGRMYMFYYDPKYKETLPYYDQFPLIFVVDVQGDHFTGLNLHYLPPPLRAKLMDGLYTIVNNNRFDATTKIKMSYQLLKSASSLKYFKPTFKKYLKIHVRSRFVSVAPIEWDVAIFLPTERFEKAVKSKVWSDSRNIIKYGRAHR